MKKTTIIATMATIFLFLSNTTTGQNAAPITTNVQTKNGIFIFWPQQQPNCNYEYIATVKTPNVVKSVRADYMLSILLEKFEKLSLPRDGKKYAMIISDNELSTAEIIILKCDD